MTRGDASWIQTYSGRQVWPLDPLAEDIVIEDIAHALSLTCRFNGHTRLFYSVAQHSVLVSYYSEDRMWGLLHDAAEAYLSDIPRPVKRRFAEVVLAEERLMEVVAEVFGLSLPMPKEIKRVDLSVLAAECRDLMGSSLVAWDALGQVSPVDCRIVPWAPEVAERTFRGRFEHLR